MSRYRFVITAIMPEFRFMARNLYGKIAGPICGLIPEKEERGGGGLTRPLIIVGEGFVVTSCLN